MDLIMILGYVGAIVIGLILGLIGGGGSILTVPIFVYLLGIDPVTATAYSLFVVGSVSAVGTGKNLYNGMVNYEVAFVFAIPALLSVFSVRKFIIPAIPDAILEMGGFTLTKDFAIMIFFAALMVAASISMIRDNRDEVESDNADINYIRLGFLGLGTGLLTGIVGSGGGFIIIPLLVLLAGLEMKKAVATTLFIIAINSLVGFLGDASQTKIDWMFLLPFAGIAVIGIFLGIWLNKFIDGKKLKKGFGWFVMAMAVYVFSQEVFFK